MSVITPVAEHKAYAQGIAAEILFCGPAAKKIGAESPVFLPAGRTKKCAHIPH
jgi:hypothetical protein